MLASRQDLRSVDSCTQKQDCCRALFLIYCTMIIVLTLVCCPALPLASPLGACKRHHKCAALGGQHAQWCAHCHCQCPDMVAAHTHRFLVLLVRWQYDYDEKQVHAMHTGGECLCCCLRAHPAHRHSPCLCFVGLPAGLVAATAQHNVIRRWRASA